MKQFKTFLLLMSLLIFSVGGFSQLVIPVQMNQCHTDSLIPGGFTPDTFRVSIPPSHGTIDTIPPPFTYCPDSSFTGNDSMSVYMCYAGICQTFLVIFDVQPPCNLSVALVQDSNMICIGGNRGYIAMPSGGSGPYTYQWSDGSTSSSACEINPGQGNCVTVTDANGCTAAGCSPTGGCQLACTIYYSTSMCPSSLEARAQGGTPPYTFLWSDGSTNSYICNPLSASYCVTIIDANGCSGTACYNNNTGPCSFTTVITDSLFPLQVNFYPVYDSLANTIAQVGWYMPGLTPNWSWQFGGIVAHFITPGYYYVAMNIIYTSGDSCFYSEYVLVGDTSNLCNLSLSFTQNICAGPLPSVQVDVSGGTPPYTYTWSNSNTNQVLCNLQQGTYCVTITDANGCTVSGCSYVGGCQLACTINYGTSGTFSYLVSSATGGTQPYSYQWSNGDSLYYIANPVNGTYCVTITDINGCSGTTCYSVNNCQISVSFTLLPGSGYPWPKLVATVSGGTAPYIYQWDQNPWINTDTILNLLPGLYAVSITDSNGCSTIGTYMYNGMGVCSYSYVADSLGNVSFTALYDSSLNTVVQSTWYFGSILGTSNALNPTKSFGGPGYYFVSMHLTYSSGDSCSYGDYVYIPGDTSICNLSIAITTNICGGPLPSIGANAGWGVMPYTYSWSNGSSSQILCNLQQGTYCVTITDANGCTVSGCSYVGGCQLACTINYGTSGTFGYLVSDATGGTQPLSYQWSNGDSLYYIANPVNGTYCVTITDANGCSCSSCYTVQTNGGCYFTYNQNPLTPDSIDFYSVTDSSLTAVSWEWDFSDGPTDSAANPTHVFLSGGYYYVCMNVNYSNGDSCVYCEYIYTYPDSTNYPCQAYFYKYIDSLNINTFHFFDYSVYNPVTWLWDFGDGNTSTQQYPTHTYATQGTWNVCLTITDASGCSSNYCEQISNVPFQDLVAYLYHATNIVPGFRMAPLLVYYNAGTILMSGSVEYRYPAGTTVNTTSETPASHDVANRLLTFNFNNLLPGTAGYIMLELNVSPSLPLGTLVYDTLWVNPVNGDVTPADNVSYITDSVVGAFDPNDKAVSPKGEGTQGVVPLATKDVSYHIRFQNTGTAPAQKVVIRDAISNNIDLTTVKVVDASHEHITEIVGNELVVTFHNINLPDSGANYEASQGYITVRAELKPGLTFGTQIFNTADIYFDFNAPIITNTVVTTLGGVFSGITATTNFDFAIMPNPANSQISLRGEFEKGSVYQLMNQLGQVMLSGTISSNNTSVYIADISSGIYFVKITSGEKTGTRKLVVAR